MKRTDDNHVIQAYGIVRSVVYMKIIMELKLRIKNE